MSDPSPTAKTWQPAAMFRWLKTKKRVYDCDGPAYDATVMTLQQAHVCMETGEVNWEDVPIVEAESEKGKTKP